MAKKQVISLPKKKVKISITPGALHRHYGVSEDETLPWGKVNADYKRLHAKAAKDNLSPTELKLLKQINLARTMKGWKK